jgi:hypothetical protein
VNERKLVRAIYCLILLSKLSPRSPACSSTGRRDLPWPLRASLSQSGGRPTGAPSCFHAAVVDPLA